MHILQSADSRRRATRLLDHVCRFFLFLLAAFAPFEQLDPPALLIFRVSSVEVLILLVLAGAGLRLVVGRPRWTFCPEIAWPALFLVLAFFLSSVFAPVTGEALRQSARLAVGLALFLIAFNELRGERRENGFILAAFGGGLLVGVLGVLEYFRVAGVDQLLKPFKVAPFQAGGLIRASSTLQYPTIASMYLEMIFGLGLGLFVQYLVRKQIWRSVLAGIALLVVTQAILGTLSRSGLGLLLLGSAAAVFVVGRKTGRGFAFAGSLLLVGAVTTVVVINSIGGLRLRLEDPDQRQWYRAQVTVLHMPEFRTGEVRLASLMLENLGRATWDSDQGYFVSYHWMDVDRDVLVESEGLRTPFEHPVGPGESIRLNARVEAPSRPGTFRLAFDVLKERSFWFSAMGSRLNSRPVEVSGAAKESRPWKEEGLPDPIFKVDRGSLWKAAITIFVAHPFLGIGPGNFKFFYGRYLDLERWDYHTHANNLYLEVLVSTGIIGGLILLFFTWRSVRLGLSCLKAGSDQELGVSIALSFAVLSFFAHGLVDYFLEFTPTYVLFWLTLGALAARVRSLGLHDARSVSNRKGASGSPPC